MLVFFAGVLALFGAAGEDHGQSPERGEIHGIVTAQDGTPAKGLRLNAIPRDGAPLGMALPWTKTDETGFYRFVRLSFGKYSVFAADNNAGYSIFTTGYGSEGNASVELTAEHPEAELNVQLPPPAAFLLFHLTNQKTGAPISGIEVTVMTAENPPKFIFSGSQSSADPVLIPSNKNLLLHVKSWGFREWDQSVGKGWQVLISPGDHLAADVQLQPANTLREQIPDADPKKYQGIHDGKDWKNPCLMVRADGVVISGVNDGNPIPVKAIEAALEKLPDSAWPYGSVVAVEDYRSAMSGPDRSQIEANKALLEPLLDELGIIPGFRPATCAP
jgi:hypothetical protein